MLDWLIAVLGVIAIIWCFPSVIVLPVISLGSFKYIIFMDKELAKDLNKYYDSYGYMRPKYQLSWEVGTRCVHYWVKYPFIRKRATTDSIKFKIFMWFNAFGVWSWIMVFFLAFLEKGLGISF
ncbi:hypothetical protein BZG13_00400 [Salinivibrio sp. ML323]|uniref:hypothetical protein n=1 Tax=Salinivibrio sp. ML323 TaxID=1909474 RepID=UPI0009879C67|nr:hypothetical protein [Salinivibrio sp. ML323]OOE60291.1 hypothetical protein BZG13_00400 [Salinivibrio sp. ML323]